MRALCQRISRDGRPCQSAGGLQNGDRGRFAEPEAACPLPHLRLRHNVLPDSDEVSVVAFQQGSPLDSGGAHGLDENCNGVGLLDQVPDGYAALRFLSDKPFVHASQVAVMGFSQGGWAVLTALEKGGAEHRATEKFRAGVALYPVCQIRVMQSDGFQESEVFREVKTF